jgi:tRNA(fMet)-specific endonuclease VapC
MPDRYLLDTNVLSHLVRWPNELKNKIAAAGEDGVCTSIVAAGELRVGALKKKSPRLTARVDELLETLDVMPLDGDADGIYAAVRARLEASGRPIGGNDYWIAAHAIAMGCTLVTDNVQKFRRVANLRVENWLR